MSTKTESVPIEFGHSPTLIKDLLEVTKPRITIFILMATSVSFYLGSNFSFDWLLLFNTLFGTALTAGGTAALNQYFERDHDSKMDRTKLRPIPSGRVKPTTILIYGISISVFGVVYLFFTVNSLTSFLAFATWFSYLFIYTPMKRLTSLNTLIGAIPGALPALGGWSAATGNLDFGAWILFLILFFWQFPHFLAIAWLYRTDYMRGGYSMLSMTEDDGSFISKQMVLYTFGLLVVSMIPSAFGISGIYYLSVALILGLAFIWSTIRFAMRRENRFAKTVLYFSFIYPIVLWTFLVLDKQ